MRNPLRKRLFRELKSDIGKYIVIFLFMTLSIGFISGFLIASGSMGKTFDENFEEYNIEDGHFELDAAISDELMEALEAEKLSIYDLSYYNEKVTGNKANEAGSILRLFKDRDEVNKVCIMEGQLPASEDEIAIDRMYAKTNKLYIGDIIHVGDCDYKITGFVALSDYSAMFENNTDTMFDAAMFGVAIINDACFDSLDKSNLHNQYAFTYNDFEPANETEENDKANEILDVILQYSKPVSYVPEYANQAINFAGEDIGKDRSMMVTLMYIIIAILSFVFSVTISNTISKEAATIGTLRASGYTRMEMLIHYVMLPVIVTLVASLIGNALGYTVFKNVAANMYYGSYSLTTYKTRWNAYAFILTTAVPLVIMALINVIITSRKLRLSPLRFIRRDLSGTKRKKAVKLPHFKFFTRFRIRVILQNMPNYLMLFIGICFADVLLLFGLMMTPLIDHFEQDIYKSMIANYQYVLKMPVATEDENAEKYLATELKISDGDEEITVFGINDNSSYFDHKLPSEGVYISDGYAQKYKLKKGDTIKLSKKYEDADYSFTVSDIITYPATLSVFMSEDDFRETFDIDENYFTGYFSDHELNDINKEYVGSVITKDDLTKVSSQLDRSIGKLFYMFNVFALIMFTLLVYLLTKLVIEKNTVPVSMVKILGYENKEINRLYVYSTTIMVIISTIIGIFVSRIVIGYLYYTIMKDFVNGWLIMWISPLTYVWMFVLSIACYAVVAIFQVRKIKHIPMDEALKNVE